MILPSKPGCHCNENILFDMVRKFEKRMREKTEHQHLLFHWNISSQLCFFPTFPFTLLSSTKFIFVGKILSITLFPEQYLIELKFHETCFFKQSYYHDMILYILTTRYMVRPIIIIIVGLERKKWWLCVLVISWQFALSFIYGHDTSL